MKKHFLLLLLSTLLPLAGWAQTDLSDGWSIDISPATATYTGNNITPVVTLVHATNPASPLSADNFTVTWDKSPIKNVDGEGYTVTVTNDMTHTFGDLAVPTKKFWVLKANSAISTMPTLIDDQVYDPEKEYTLVSNIGTGTGKAKATFGTIEYIESADEPAANAAGWSTASPKASDAGDHKVWYRVVGTDNYNGIDPQVLGTVHIEGLTPTVATAPAAIAGLIYNTQAQALITAGEGVVGGTLKYRVGSGTWSTTIPTKTTVGNYTVQWMVEGATGYNDLGPTDIPVSIAQATPEFTAAPTGVDGLVYTGKAQSLLTGPATATLNATVRYKVAFKAPDEAEYGALSAAKTLANTKATAAGSYKIVATTTSTANLNSVDATDDDIIYVEIAQKAAAAPKAIAGLMYNKEAQNLITAGEAGIVKYSTDGGANWVNVVDDIKGTNAGNYNVLYKVEDINYQAVAATAIPNVKIAQAYLTVVVKDVEKTYDADVDIPAITADDYELIYTVDDFSVTGIAYKATTKQDAGEYEEEMDVTIPNHAVNANYEINIIKGKLTINKAKLTVTANTGLECEMDDDAADYIKDQYVVAGLQGAETIADAFGTKLPVLTSNAPTPLVPGEYTLSFTKGTLSSTNYEMNTESGDGGYVIPAAAKLTVTAAAGTKVLITVVGHSKTYGENDPDYTKWVAGTDYYVSGLQAGDAIASIEFSREAGENVGQYALSATATVNHPEWYEGGIVYNNSKLTINPKELVATVAPQYFTVGTASTELDGDAWQVTGLELEDEKADLGGTLTVDPNAIDGGDNFKEGQWDITLNITNANYTLKAGSETGNLYVINATVLALDDTAADNFEKIAAADGANYDVVNVILQRKQDLPAGTAREWTAGRWNSMILPFDVTVEELSAAFGYAIFNVVDEANSTASSTKFKLEMGIDGAIPANTPFLIKTNADMPDGTVISFANKTIVAPAAAKVEMPIGSTGNKFIGTYETVTISAANPGYFWYGASDSPAHIGTSSANTWDVVPFACYVDQNELNQSAHEMTFIYEDLNGETTAIRSISADEIDKAKAYGEGWYNLNGVKMQGVPTEKGIYIMNGKKVVLK